MGAQGGENYTKAHDMVLWNFRKNNYSLIMQPASYYLRVSRVLKF